MKPRFLVLVLVISIFSAPFVRAESDEDPEDPEEDGHHEDGHNEEQNEGGHNEEQHEDGHHEEQHEDGHHEEQHEAPKENDHHEDPKDESHNDEPKKGDGDPEPTHDGGSKGGHDEGEVPPPPPSGDSHDGDDGKKKEGEGHPHGEVAEHKETATGETPDDPENDDNTAGEKVTYGGYQDLSGMPDSPDAIAAKETALEKDETVAKAVAESQNGGQPPSYEAELKGVWTTLYSYSELYPADELVCWQTDYTQSNYKATESQIYQDGNHDSWQFTMQPVDDKSKTLETHNMASPRRKLSKIYVLLFKDGVIGYYSCKLFAPEDDKRVHNQKDKPNCQAGIAVKDATTEVIKEKKSTLEEAKSAIKQHLGIDVVDVKTDQCSFNKNVNEGKTTSESDDKPKDSTAGGTETHEPESAAPAAPAHEEPEAAAPAAPAHEEQEAAAPAAPTHEEEEHSEHSEEPPAPSASSIDKPAAEGGEGGGEAEEGSGEE